jgi:hypothetical protein
MTGLDILKALLGNAESAVPSALPPDELRFILEYREQPNLDAERRAIAEALGSEAFVLLPLFEGDAPELRRFVVLRFPGVERTLSRETLFQVAYALADLRGLASAEPDLGTPTFADPAPRMDGPRGESMDVFGLNCWVDADPPEDRRWVLRTTGVLRAWERFESRGAGVLIAQPDTGVVAHDELDPASLRLDLAADILGGDADPTDPLRPGMANPGHGTSTASVVVSRLAGDLAGPAPEALLVPIRCIEDVKVFNASPVARAIEHATRTRCDVITMSLGGVPSRAMRAACRAAIDAGVIVLAAAGNCVRLVVYPARYPEVIAVAGVNVDDVPWVGTSRGSRVDVAAPAELVWRALRSRPSDPTGGISPGQGTSFAVALTAGVAALWLARHGREAVRAEAAGRGRSVQALFQAALRQSARLPDGWDATRFGAGIVDAEALLALELGQISTAAVESAAAAANDEAEVESLLAEAMGPGPRDPGFDFSRFGLEVAGILYEDARAGRRPGDDFGAESSASKVRASTALASRGRASADPRLQALVRRSGTRSAQAPDIRTPESVAPGTVLQILARPEGSGLESSAGISPEAARSRLRGAGMREVLDRAERILAQIESREGRTGDAARQQLMADAERVLEQLVRGEAAPATGGGRVALEALVQLAGRPAIRVEGGTVDPNHPELGEWQGAYLLAQSEIDATFASIGRIDRDGEHVGTGIVVAEGIVMTNRHVVEAFAAPVPTRTSPKRWVLESEGVTIDFSEGADGSRSFAVKSVIEAGPNPIGGLVDFVNLDVALLEVETTSASGDRLPKPLPQNPDATRVERPSQIYVVGYPARPAQLPTDAEGKVRMEVVTRLREIFGVKYGRKYFSPGLVSAPRGSVANDPKGWVFNHDATTLGGNSGSAAIYLGDPIAIVGLHFAGDWLRANHAHALGAVKAAGGLSTLPRLHWL